MSKKIISVVSKHYGMYGPIEVGGLLRYDNEDYKVVSLDNFNESKLTVEATVLKVGNERVATRSIFGNYRVASNPVKVDEPLVIYMVDAVGYEDGSVEAYRFPNGEPNLNEDKTIVPAKGESTPDEPVGPAAKIGDKEYENLSEAFADITAGDTLELENDCTMGADYTFNMTGEVTILLNQHQITDGYSIIIPEGLTLNMDAITNRVITGEGYVTNHQIVSSDPYRIAYTAVPTTWPVTIRSTNGDEVRYEDWTSAIKAATDGDVLVMNEDMPNQSLSLKAPSVEGMAYTATIDLNGHTFNGVSSVGGWTTTITGEGAATNTASSATKAVQAYGGAGTIIIENGTYTGGIALYSAPGYNETTAEAIVNGGTFIGSNNAIKIEKASGSSRTNYGKITINGGNFEGAINVPDAAKENFIITGGTFSVDPSAFVDMGNYHVEEADGKFTVKLGAVNNSDPEDQNVDNL